MKRSISPEVHFICVTFATAILQVQSAKLASKIGKKMLLVGNTVIDAVQQFNIIKQERPCTAVVRVHGLKAFYPVSTPATCLG